MITCDLPLSTESRWKLFEMWCDANPDTLAAIEMKALSLVMCGHRRISTQYLVEYARYDLPYKNVGVPFLDNNGKEHVYRINNNDCAALGRLLKERHPNMPIELRRSMLDDRRRK